LSAASNVCGSWYLTVRREYRLKVLENRVLRRIFGRKRKEVTACCRKIHDEEPHNLYSSNIFMMIILGRTRWAGHAEEEEK
jgi:hypothetical protein